MCIITKKIVLEIDKQPTMQDFDEHYPWYNKPIFIVRVKNQNLIDGKDTMGHA